MTLDKLLSQLDIDVQPFALCLVSKGWRLRLPGPPEVMLHFGLKGEGSVLGPSDQPHAFGPCSFAIIPRGAVHALEPAGGVENELSSPSPCEAAALPQLIAGSSQDPDMTVACGILRVGYGGSLGLFDHLREILAVDMSDLPFVEAAFREILEEQSHPTPGTETLTAALMKQCLVHLFRKLGGDNESPLPWLAALEDPRLARALDKILDHPGADHTVDSLAETASMSRSAFAEHFAEAFGRPPMSLVHQMRMQLAMRLLRQQGGTLSVDEIATRVGFSSRSHFSRAFKKHCGISPAEYKAGTPASG
jgi:AraC-like DNA-binding protein